MRLISMIAYMMPAFIAGGCAYQSAGAPGDSASWSAPYDDGACPVYESDRWSAWVKVVPGAEAMLHIKGRVTLPTPGHRYMWRTGAVDKSNPPVQHLHLIFPPPQGLVAQVLTSMDGSYAGATFYRKYLRIVVHCGDGMLTEIDDVQMTH